MSFPARRRGPRASKKGQMKGQESESTIIPDVVQVLAAIRSLYDEELKPFGRILRKRVAELAVGANSDSQLPNVDAGHLRRVCDDCDSIHVEHEEGGDWSALLKNVQAKLVNIYSPQDLYSQEFWALFRTYFEGIGNGSVLPGGRYSCAQVLMDRTLPFLDGYSLGQVCHIVQLAVSNQKILGYRNGRLVPYSQSKSMLKEQYAVWHRPCTGVALSAAALPLASWQAARAGVRTMLTASACGGSSGPGTLPLSNVKRIFRHQFQLDLSETALGYSKLCDLLQDARFQDICTIHLEDNGYTVVGVSNPSKQTTNLEQRLLTGDGGPVHAIDALVMVDASKAVVKIKNSFIHVMSLESGSRARALSTPRDFSPVAGSKPFQIAENTDDSTDAGSRPHSASSSSAGESCHC